MTTSTLSLFLAGLLLKYNFVVSRLKHLTPKTTSLGNSKMWSTIFFTFKIDGDIRKFVQLIKTQKKTV